MQLKPQFLWRGVLFAALFWVGDCVLGAFVFRGGDFTGELFHPQPIEIYFRLLVGCLLIALTHARLERSEQRRTEREFDGNRTSSLPLADANNVTHFGSWDWNIETDTFSWSDEIFGIFGFPEKSTGTLESFLSRVHPDDREQVKATFEHTRHGGGSLSTEYRITLPSGEERIIHSRGRTYCDDPENPGRMIGTAQDITGQQTRDRELRERGEQLRLALEAAGMGTWSWDIDTNQVQWSEQVELIFGLAPGEFDGRYETYSAFLHPDEHPLMEKAISEALGSGSEYEVEHRITRTDGKVRWLHGKGKALLNERGEPLRMMGTVADITEQKRVSQQLQRMQFSIDHAADAVYWWDSQGRLLYVNDEACRSLRYSRKDLMELTIHEIDSQLSTETFPDFWTQVRRSGSLIRESKHRRRDGTVFPIELNLNYVEFEGEGFVSAFARNIRRRKRAQKQLAKANRKLRKLVELDPLTGLLNRRGLERILRLEAERARRNGHRLVALLADCDGFKRINDTGGHAAGDIALKEIASRLSRELRSIDHLARIGGDEFLVLLPQTRLGEGRYVTKRLSEAVSGRPIHTIGKPSWMTLSFGVAEVPHDVRVIEEILALADPALKQAKQRGHSRTGLVDDEAQRLELVEQLQFRKDLYAVYQPIVSFADNREIGREVFIRGNGRLFSSPNDLFGACQNHELLTLADLACLRTCLQAAAESNFQGQFHLNIFPSTLLGTAGQQIVGLLRAQRPPLPLHHVCIELGEQQFVGDPVNLREPVRILKNAGVTVSLDDVGFGKSSIEALVLLEPEFVKVDRVWIQGISTDRAKAQSLKRMVRLVQSLGATLIAEGIENKADLKRVIDTGVEYGQGFYWGQPQAFGLADKQSLREICG